MKFFLKSLLPYLCNLIRLFIHWFKSDWNKELHNAGLLYHRTKYPIEEEFFNETEKALMLSGYVEIIYWDKTKETFGAEMWREHGYQILKRRFIIKLTVIDT